MAKPILPDIETLIQAGINPKTGLPIKFGSKRCTTKEDIKKALRLIDEQDAVNRYTWKNIPANITSQELERMLYYKGQLCFFYLEELNQYFFMPYALDGTIDFYSRFNTIHPVPMSAGTDDKGSKAQADYLSSIKLNCIYKLPEDLSTIDANKSTVLLHDYSKQLSQTIIPRVNVNDPILDIQSDCLPFMRTALLMGTGVKGVRVQDADQEASVHEGARNMTTAALSCEPYIPIVGSIEFQELTNGNVAKAEEYLLAMQAIENFRLSTYGIDNGGLFDKKAYVNKQDGEVNGGPIGLVMQDGLSIRKNFCEIANAIFGLNMSVEVAENIYSDENMINADEDYTELKEDDVEVEKETTND